MVGKRQPNLSERLADATTHWQFSQLEWYGAKTKRLALSSGTALWYHTGETPLPIGWVLVRDPAKEGQVRAFFSTDQAQAAEEIVVEFVKRWSVEVTFEESRAHLGFETQRYWSDRASERSTPLVLGLYSLVALIGEKLYQAGKLKPAQSAWYRKEHLTFSDLLAGVRRGLWREFSFQTSPSDPEVCLVTRDELERLAFAACY